MGFFKQMKDMKKAVEAAPGLVSQAQQLGAQAQQMQAAQTAAAQNAVVQQQAAAAGAPAPSGPEFEPIAGVSIERYVEISRACAAAGATDLTQAAAVAASHGIPGPDWQAAVDGWNARLHNPAVAQRFNQLYTGR
jgi:hypothetical protein